MLAARSNAGLATSAAAAAAPKRFAHAEAHQEDGAAGRKSPDDDLERRPGDQRVLRARSPRCGPPGRRPVRREDADRRIGRAHDPGRRMRDQYGLGEPLRRNGGERLRRQRRGIGGVVGVEPGALDPRHVRQPRHRPRMLVAGDEVGEVAAVLEQERRGRRRRADVEARHRPEEVRPGDALRRREDRRQRVDQADGDVVAIDAVAPRRGLAARAGDPSGAARSGSSSAAAKAAA